MIILQSGREIVFLGSKRYPDFHIRRIDWVHAAEMRIHSKTGQLPAVVVLNVAAGRFDWLACLNVFHELNPDV